MVASIYGPLSGSGTYYTSDIDVTEPASRTHCTLSSCKRRLMFTQRIFQGEAIYLDLRTANGSRQRTSLETDLKALGAKVEGFLSRDVTHVITDRTDAGATTPNSGAAGGFSSPVPTGYKGGSLKTPKAAPAAFSRAQALLNRSVSRQQQQEKTNAATDPVSLAKLWGIRVTLLQKVLHIIEREKAKCDPNRKLTDSKHGYKKGTVRVRKLEGAFIKVEDMSCQFRPSSKNFPSFPVIDVNDPAISHNQSPFNLRRKPQATKAQDNAVKADDNVSKPVPVVKEKPCVQQQDEGTPSIKKPAVKQVPKAGFCEVCDTTYRNLKEHANSDTHQKFALGTDNFNSLDCIISKLPSLAQLQSDLSNLCISEGAESNDELGQDFTKDSLSEEKSDLNCGALTESQKGLKTPERLAPPIEPSQDVPMDTAELSSSDRSVNRQISQPMITQTNTPVTSQMVTVISETLAAVTSQTAAAVSSQTVTPVISQTMTPVILQRQLSSNISHTDQAEVRVRTPTSCSTLGYEQDCKPQEGSTAPYTCSAQPVFINHSNDVCHTTSTCTDTTPTSDCDKQRMGNESPMAIDNAEDIGKPSFSAQGCAFIEIEKLQRSEELLENPASITSESLPQKRASSENQRCLETLQKSAHSKSIPSDSAQAAYLSSVDKNEDSNNALDEVLLLTPYKVAHPMSDPTGVTESPRSAVMPTLTPQKTPLKDFTPGKCNSDMRVLSESAVQAVLKELTFLNNNDVPMESLDGDIDLSGDSRSGSDSFPSMPELHAEVGLNPLDAQTNDATMPEPLSSRGSCFDVSPVKLITQFSFGCIDRPESSYDASSKSQSQFTAVKDRTVIENYSIDSHHSAAVLPDSVSDSKNFLTSFSNILSRISADSSQVKNSDPCTEVDNSNDAHSVVLDKTLTEEDQSCESTVVSYANHSMPVLQAIVIPVAKPDHETPNVEFNISQELQDEQMEFSDLSSDHVENSIAQNLLARLQEQSSSGSEEEDNDSAPDVLLHYNGGIQQEELGSDALAKAAKDLINVDNVFCGESVVCDSRSTATMHAPLDNISCSPNDTGSSIIPVTNIPNIVCGDTDKTQTMGQIPTAFELPKQWMSDQNTTFTPTMATTQGQPHIVENICLLETTVMPTTHTAHSQPHPVENMCLVETTVGPNVTPTTHTAQTQPHPAEKMCLVETTVTPTTHNTQTQPHPLENMCVVKTVTSGINQNKKLNTANPSSAVQFAVNFNREEQPMSCSQESNEYSSVLLSSSNVNMADDPLTVIEAEEPAGRWSPSMILNPVNLWWTDTNTSRDQSSAAATNVKLKTPVKMPPKSYSQSPNKGSKVLASKVQKKSKKSKSDKERISHSSEKKHKKSSKTIENESKGLVIPERSKDLDTSASLYSEEMSHKKKKSKSHKHKSHKSKDRSPDSKSEKRKAKESKMKETSTTLSPHEKRERYTMESLNTKESITGSNSEMRSVKHKSKKSKTKETTGGLSTEVKSDRHKSEKRKSKESKMKELSTNVSPHEKRERYTMESLSTKEPIIGSNSELRSVKHKSKKSKTKETTVVLSTEVKSHRHISEKHKSKESKMKEPSTNLSPHEERERYTMESLSTKESIIGSNSELRSVKHKSKKSKTKETTIGLSSEVKSDRRKSKKSKTRESTGGLTPKAKADILPSVTPKVAKPVLGGGTPSTPTVTWTATPSRGLKIKICKVVTPLQEKPLDDNHRYGALALYEQHVMGATPSTGKHKHKKHKLDKGHRRRKLDL